MTLGSQIKVGMIIKIDDELYKVVKTEHVMPGKGVAFMQTRLKNVLNPKKNLDKRFRSSEKVEQVDLIEIQAQYLYNDATNYFFMNTQSYEQIEVESEVLGEKAVFLVAENSYGILTYNENPVDVILPQSVVLEVSFAAPEIKKVTASASLRPVTVENDLTIQAPSFIKTGDKIRVNTETKEYIERVR